MVQPPFSFLHSVSGPVIKLQRIIWAICPVFKWWIDYWNWKSLDVKCFWFSGVRFSDTHCILVTQKRSFDCCKQFWKLLLYPHIPPLSWPRLVCLFCVNIIFFVVNIAVKTQVVPKQISRPFHFKETSYFKIFEYLSKRYPYFSFNIYFLLLRNK
jgi:hypothetical protein